MDVCCNKLPHRFSPGEKKHPRIPGFTNINVCTSGGHWSALSPMRLGPLRIVEPLTPTLDFPSGLHPGFRDLGNGLQESSAMNFENYWQFSKVYDLDLDPQGQVQSSFLYRRAQGFADPKPHRRAFPKNKAQPVSSYFEGRFLSYLEARIRYYCPIYAQLVVQTPIYQELFNRHLNEPLQLLGYDGRNLPITREAMNQEILRTAEPFGHEFVLCCLLKGLSPWTDPEVLAQIN